MPAPDANKEVLDFVSGIIYLWEMNRRFAAGLYLSVVIAPGALAWISRLFSSRKIEKLYKERLKDKDGEISRQALRIKELENASLKRARQ